MRAVTQQIFGDPDVLTLSEVPPPKALPTEIVVRARAVGVNTVEGFIRSGRFPLLGQPPFILGWDVSGMVETVVPGTNRFKPGDEVFGMPLEMSTLCSRPWVATTVNARCRFSNLMDCS
jgi:NADPH:quinone reductase-like Zn-dependent oxidoreductase